MLHELLCEWTQKSEFFVFSWGDSNIQLGLGITGPMRYQVPMIWNLFDDRIQILP